MWWVYVSPPCYTTENADHGHGQRHSADMAVKQQTTVYWCTAGTAVTAYLKAVTVVCLCKDKQQYLLTLKVRSYCCLSLHLPDFHYLMPLFFPVALDGITADVMFFPRPPASQKGLRTGFFNLWKDKVICGIYRWRPLIIEQGAGGPMDQASGFKYSHKHFTRRVCLISLQITVIGNEICV